MTNVSGMFRPARELVTSRDQDTGESEISPARRWAAEDAAEAKERDVQALAESLRENEIEAQKAAKAAALRERQFKHWDMWRQSPVFTDYMIARGLRLREWPQIPRSIDMEMACLGAMMMLLDEPVTAAMRRLHPRHFGYAFDKPLRNASIFLAITNVEKRRQVDPSLRSIDLLSVCEELGRMKAWDTNTVSYLSACIDATPGAANIDFYINVVIEKSRLRHMVFLGEMLQDAASEPDAEPSRLFSLISNATAAIYARGWCDLKAIFEKEK